ncbi:WD-repeat protein [Cryptosporidium ryanae]|uniref:WD-repeat protein n=1 Tax=Cryptosporidium bovis TaxID=310047 RepID=UPI00351AAA7B|nr:WD-repeat protein [Cryptosporidium bovis]KAH8738482.1 WD-repeat protein [Cryptosporidium ryanae]
MRKGIQIVDYSSSSEDETNTEKRLSDFKNNSTGENVNHKHEDSNSENDDFDGINSLANVLKLHEKCKSNSDKEIEYPINSYIKFRDEESVGSAKHITCLSLPIKGQKMVCGTLNGEIEIYEFNNLFSNDLKPSRVMCPLEDHSIRSIKYNNNGSMIIAACGDSICRVFDGNGDFINGTVKGDPYVKAVKTNYGHTHTVLDCKWDTLDENQFITSSMDNTIRLFNLNSEPFGIDKYIPSHCVMKCLDKRKLNISSIQVNSINVSTSGEYVVSSCTDGSIQLFHRNGNLFSDTPNIIIRDSHTSENNSVCISDVNFIKYKSTQDRYVVSRGIIDSCIKVWDIRKTNKPINTFLNIYSDGNCEYSKFIYSKCGKNILISTNKYEKRSDPSSIKGSIVSISAESLVNLNDNVKQHYSNALINTNSEIKSFEWSHNINQLIICLNNGNIIIYYDDTLEDNPSNKGIITALKQKKRIKDEDGFHNAKIQTYNIEELPEGFRETKSGEIKYIGVASKKSRLYGPKNLDPNRDIEFD